MMLPLCLVWTWHVAKLVRNPKLARGGRRAFEYSRSLDPQRTCDALRVSASGRLTTHPITATLRAEGTLHPAR